MLVIPDVLTPLPPLSRYHVIVAPPFVMVAKAHATMAAATDAANLHLVFSIVNLTSSIRLGSLPFFS
jgi:hypothetical protein